MNSLKAGATTFQRSRPGLFVKKVMDDQAANLAALLAWGTLSALLPLLLGMLSLAGFILRDSRRMDEVYNAIVAVLPSQAAGPVTAVLEGMRQQSAASAGIVAILLLLFNGSGFFSNMAGVFDKAYHVEPRNFIVERLVGIGLLLVTTALLVASTLAAGLGSLVGNVPIGLPIGTVLGRAIGWLIPVVCVLALFLLIYRVLPNAKQGWRHVAPGALLSSVLLLVISQVFPLYVTLFPPNQAYALFGVFLVFTFWLYLVGIILVLGAELNAFLQEPTTSATPGGPFEAQDAERPRNHLIANAPRTNVPATSQASNE